MTHAVALPLPAFAPLLRGLLDHGLLISTGAPGLWGKGDVFERVVAGIERAIDAETESDGATRVRYPPVVRRTDFDRSEFLKSFPQLAGAIHAFDGDAKQHAALLERIESGGDWSDLTAKTEFVLAPAACYPVYPSLSGELPGGGRLFDVSAYCFRHEPTLDPTRMVSFRMREHVRVGSNDEVCDFRARWVVRAEALARGFGLAFSTDPANDPFFGRAGRWLAVSQLAQGLKLELRVPVVSEESPTAVMSFNYHQDHFGHAFDIRTADGKPAHSACVGFGLERIALALFASHGFDPELWSPEVRTRVFG